MTLKLEGKIRELTGKKVSKLRQTGKIPAVLYGRGIPNRNLELDAINFNKIYQQAGESTLIDLVVDGQPIKTIIADVQYEPVKHQIAHVDFQQIRMDEKINATVEIKLVGESRVVKEEMGSLVHNLSELEIRCLPGDLIHEIEVDVSVLDSFDDVVKIKDLKLPANVEIIGHEPEDIIVTMARPKVEAEIVPSPAEGEAEGEVKGEESSEADKTTDKNQAENEK